MSLINSESNLILTWPENCVISNAAVSQATTFSITDTKLYVPVVILSNEDNAIILQQLKSGFKRTVNWNKCQPKTTTQNPINQYLYHPSFEEVNSFFLPKNANDSEIRNLRYCLPTAKVEDYNVMVDSKNFLINQLKMISKYMITFEKLQLVKEVITL